MRFLITNEIWGVFGPLVERCASPLGPEPELTDHMFFKSVLYRDRAGRGRRDLPGEFGDWDAVYNRLRWIHSGRLKEFPELMAERPECEGLRRLMIDSTIVRMHQHAAGARRKKKDVAAKAIGPSRGGLTTKVVAVARDADGVVAADGAEGQRHDSKLAAPVLAEAEGTVEHVVEVVADRGVLHARGPPRDPGGVERPAGNLEQEDSQGAVAMRRGDDRVLRAAEPVRAWLR